MPSVGKASPLKMSDNEGDLKNLLVGDGDNVPKMTIGRFHRSSEYGRQNVEHVLSHSEMILAILARE